MDYTLIGWTSEEEVEALLSAGLNPESADMSYDNICTKGFGYISAAYQPKAISYKSSIELMNEIKGMILQNGEDGFCAWRVKPCWTLGTLISIMPQRIGLFTLVWNVSSGIIEYKVDIDSEHTDKLVSKYDIPSLVVWLLENGYMDNNKVLGDGKQE